MVPPIIQIRIASLWFAAIEAVQAQPIKVVLDIFLSIFNESIVVNTTFLAPSYSGYVHEVVEPVQNFVHRIRSHAILQWVDLSIGQNLEVVVKRGLAARTRRLEQALSRLPDLVV